jgi:RNA polymerase sigma factor (sigma-70 family)
VVQAGEPVRGQSEFQEFYEANYGHVVALVAGVLGDRHQAEDVAQEAFARAMTRWPRLSGYDLPEAWVRQVALRIAIDSGRRVRRAVRAYLRLADQASQSRGTIDRFYLLRLSASGRPGRLTQLSIRPLRDAQIYGMALTADASKLAVAWQNIPTGPERTHIDVSTLATGATRSWTSASGAASAVSWAGQRTLAFEWQGASSQAQSGVRLLDTAAAGRSPLSSRLLVPASTRIGSLASPGNPLISQDGSVLFATMGGTGPHGKTAIVRFSARTGRWQAVLTPAAAAAQSPWYCGVLWTSPPGTHLLTQCGATQGRIEGGRYTTVHLPWHVRAAVLGYTNTFAW